MDPNSTAAAEQPQVKLARSTSDHQQHSGPPRAKLALLTWVGAYAVILGVLAVGGPTLAGWPLALRALVVSGLMVAAMTWVIVPLMTRLFRGWLLR
jgi:antibiotic biosynthesis monooxygenase (ABM) superfamily enzyme